MRKKICLVSLGNLYLSPYIEKYLENIDCDYDLIYWNRHGLKEDNQNAKKIYSFDYELTEDKGKIMKLIGYIKFKNFMTRILNENQYSGIILLQTSVGILLLSILKRSYKKKYILDIRDYTMEKNPLFLKIIKWLVKNSAYSIISSDGFKNFLPEHEYILVHNDIALDTNKFIELKNEERSEKQINISCIGLIRFHDQNIKVIDKFKNDERFRLKFIGTGALALKEYCYKVKALNVELVDRFPTEETLRYYLNTDLINNLYGNNSPLLDHALSNKLYYAAKLKIPILVSPKTHMASVVSKYGLGFVFDLDDYDSANDLYEFYESINRKDFEMNCEKFLTKVNAENELFKRTVSKFVEDLK
ncbi:capsular biosynthesis protein [Chryseomicrobium sp. FSL W7-1435]|uniref:capsular biosynthesis protein n=1 Tax=Chryseomicrobium sp. FSL W7-1435 TaxID=2921704 RepID=UPI0031599F91